MVQRSKRDVHGILLLDKPLGISSNQALTEVKHLFQAKKAGHTGSLDPLASGMLPICLGEATKFSQFLLEADKQYQVTAKLGLRTTTGDAEGKIVLNQEVSPLSTANLEEVLTHFRGVIEQIPSMYSALKHRGKPLYSYARQGIEIDRPSRTVTIKELTLLEYDEQNNLTLRVTCSKGTYIRTLVDDIGMMLGCGASVVMLRRIYVAPYHEQQMLTLEELRDIAERKSLEGLDTGLLPLDSALQGWPELTLTESLTFYMRQGQPIIVPKAPRSGLVRLFSPQSYFIGVGEILDDGRVAPRRLISSRGVQLSSL